MKRKLLVFSASQLGQWDRCPAYWAWRRVRGLEEPQTNKAALGTAIHREMELWGLLGVEPTSKAGKKLKSWAPDPGTAEVEVRISFTTDGVPFTGLIDVAAGWCPETKEYRPLEPGAPVILVDWKTTSGLKYAKDEATLRDDAAVNLYAFEAYEGGATDVYCRWLYIQADGGSRVHEVYFRLHEPDVRRKVAALVARGAILQELYASDVDPNTLDKDRNGCFAYGSQCPAFDLCSRPVVKRSWDDLDKEDDVSEDFKAAMVQAFPKKAPPLPPKKAPPLPVQPKVVVPVAPPPEDTEALLLDAVAPEKAGWLDIEPVVEAGFVNAPEGADIPLVATPEEAAAQQGIEPPKPPEADDLDALDKHMLRAMAIKMGIDPRTKAREPGLKAYIRAERARADLLGEVAEPVFIAEPEESIMTSVLEAAEGLHAVGAIDDTAMMEFRSDCTPDNDNARPEPVPGVSSYAQEILDALERDFCLEGDYIEEGKHPVRCAMERMAYHALLAQPNLAARLAALEAAFAKFAANV